MSTFTVFFCGTGSNSEDYKNPNYGDGELISTLARNHSGLEFDDWIIADGPGSGNLQEDDKWTKPGHYTQTRGTAFGSGWEENVKHAIAVIKKKATYQRTRHTDKEKNILRGAGIAIPKDTKNWIRQTVNPERKITPQALQQARAKIMRRPLPDQVNLIGWSRGAVTCHMMANAMKDDDELSRIAVNIFAVDPVPGSGNFQKHRTTVANNVLDYFVVYARDERSMGFAPTVSAIEVRGKSNMLVLPGKHATVVGNAFADGGDKGDQIFSAPGKIVRNLAEKFLRSHDTNLENQLTLNVLQQLKLYEAMLEHETGYVKMRDDVYTKKEHSDNERLMGVGSNWWSIKLSAVEQLKPDDTFVNWHHRSLWISVFGGLRNKKRLNDQQRALKQLLPITSRRVFGS